MVSRIKELCKEHGITIAALQKELGLGNNAINRWDVNSPSVDKVMRVAEYFGVSIDYLMGRTETKETANKGGLPDDVAELITLMQSYPRVRSFVLRQISTYKAFLAPKSAEQEEN